MSLKVTVKVTYMYDDDAEDDDEGDYASEDDAEGDSKVNTCTPTHLLPTAAITRSAHVIMSAIVISSTISLSQPEDSCHFFQ